MTDRKPQLTDGSEWADHEDCIIGDEAGLRNLIQACEAAIENGENYGEGLGDYVGVKKLESSWFKDPVDSPHTLYVNCGLAAFLAAVGGFILVGMGTVLSWLF